MILRCFLAFILVGATIPCVANELPVVTFSDDRLVIEVFAEHPQLVTPTGIAVDRDGAVYVAESHTHFRPDDYVGPEQDRILVFRDQDRDGVADERSVFHSGFTHVMDIEFHPDGSLYVATRMDIHRLSDTDRDGRADQVRPIVQMETSGTYPHNGISGLSFDLIGNLHFGLGENLGHEYTLVGSDGRRLAGGGEGGSTYWVEANGTNLRRVTTGWWNPFGTCTDAFGRVFGTDNDPGASPPCRLHQIVEQADYGYEYRYGRTGLHPLITWTGDLPGTLPMIAGTGEAPCSVLAYEAGALPDEYRGRLFLTSWADHRIEQYELSQSPDSGLVSTERTVLFQSQGEFRPVDMSIAPDGSIYVTDWVSSSYQLHGLGRIWRITSKSSNPRPTSTADAQTDLFSADRWNRERAARELLDTDAGVRYLEEVVHDAVAQPEALNDLQRRATSTAVRALATMSNTTAAFDSVADSRLPLPVRQLALREHLRRGNDPSPWLTEATPVALRSFALFEAGGRHRDAIRTALHSTQPLLFHAAVTALSRNPMLAVDELAHAEPRVRLGAVLALKRHPIERKKFADAGLAALLRSEDPTLRFVAVKWVADEQLTQHRSALNSMLEAPDLDYRVFLAITAAFDRLDDKPPQDRPATPLLLQQLQRESSPLALKRLALRLLDPRDASVPLDLLSRLAHHPDVLLRREAVQTLAERTGNARDSLLVEIAQDRGQPAEVRAVATAGLARAAQPPVELLVELATSESAGAKSAARDEALRSLFGESLTGEQLDRLRAIARGDDDVVPAVERLVTGKVAHLPDAGQLERWEEILEETGDPESGRRIFFGAKLGKCADCHQVEGRGQAVGPDLSSMHRRVASLGTGGQRWLLETILQPSRQMAPQYTPWLIELTDGRQLVGLPRRKGGNAEAYLGVDGHEFTVQKSDIERHAEMEKSLMPDGLLSNLTPREVRDLIAYISGETLR